MVIDRKAKRVTLTPEAQKALDIVAVELSPFQLIQCILRAPVDLLWFGGIGTYVKSTRAGASTPTSWTIPQASIAPTTRST